MNKIILLIKYFFSLYNKIFYKNFWNFSLVKYPNYIKGKKYITIWKNSYIWKYSFIYMVTEYNKKYYTPNLKIGNNVWIWQNLHISCIKSIVIEDSVMISRWVFIWDSFHDFSDINKPIKEQDMVYWGDVIIKEWSFIGINACIMPWVSIWRNSIVWANSVVTKNVPDYSVVGGVPAKVIKNII